MPTVILTVRPMVKSMIKRWLAQYASPFALGDMGIMGMNQRNISYISRYNPRRLYPLVDDKLETKRIALDAG